MCTKREVKLRFNFSVWFAMRKSGNLYIVLLIELQGHVEEVSVELYFAFS